MDPDRAVRVGLVQINNSFSNQHYFPYSTGLLQAYAQSRAPQPQAYTFLPHIYRRLRVDDAVRQLQTADLVGFSSYVWNFRLSLAVARRLKALKPEITIVFGGPHVPQQAEAYLRENPFIDLAVHGEGEHTFLEVLEAFRTGRTADWGDAQGVSFLDPARRFVHRPQGERIKDMSVLPSPYLEGLFTGLMEENPDHHWLALWETNRGCPFSCTFCDWGSATQSKVFRFDLERLLREIDWFSERRIEFIFCCDANFGILKRDLEIAEYAARAKQSRGYPHALSVQNTKNATERAYEVQKLLADAGLNKGVTLSLQSVDPHTLESIKRQNISSDSYAELQRRFTRDGIETYTDMILALPGETYDTFVDGVAEIIDNGQHNRIQFNNLSILPNAEMGDPAYQEKFGMVTVCSEIINVHGAVADEQDDISEMQDLVIGTSTMPGDEWVRTRAFSWWASFLHFDKVLQIPLVLLRENCSIGYRELFEVFSEVEDAERFPVLCAVRKFFLDKARDIQAGGPEYCSSEKWLRIWWPADEYMLIDLAVSGRLASFYAEAQAALEERIGGGANGVGGDLLREAIALNRALLKIPFETDPIELELSFNIWDAYRGALRGETKPVRRESSRIQIDRSEARWPGWDDWCREVIWYGNKKGAYLYGGGAVERQLDGHY